jgi:crotonobetainyl-CoA:carnitine CoA-transferase CaiB-like acyl-CoA transferase
VSAALDGIKILDFTRFQAGPTGTVLLSDLGAEVIKVEFPGRGEQGRYIYPLPGTTHTPYFIAHDRGKRGITVDYGKPEGREILYRIGAGCDVVVENFRPGQADALGLGYEAFRASNPRLVYASVSAFGEQGPLASCSGFDIHGQAMGGIMSVAGREDASYTAGPAIGDQLAGMTLVSAILAALFARERQGIGQKAAVSLYGCQIALQAWEIDHCSLSGRVPPKAGTSHPMLHESGMIWGSFPTQRGDIVLGGLGGDRWPAFCELLGIDPGPAADAAASFTADKSAFRPLIEKKLRERTADEWLPLFRERDLMISKVNTYAEILADPQARANGYIIEMDAIAGGTARVVGSPFQLSQTPVQPKGPPPELGQHTEEVLLECGYDWDDIARWRESGII